MNALDAKKFLGNHLVDLRLISVVNFSSNLSDGTQITYRMELVDEQNPESDLYLVASLPDGISEQVEITFYEFAIKLKLSVTMKPFRDLIGYYLSNHTRELAKKLKFKRDDKYKPILKRGQDGYAYKLRKGNRVVMHSCMDAMIPKNFGFIWKCLTNEFTTGEGTNKHRVVFLEGLEKPFPVEFLQVISLSNL